MQLRTYLHGFVRHSCLVDLGQTIDHWLQNEFVKKEHAKCLILIGRRGCGKSTFARSLPGPVNYFDQSSVDMKSWSNYARYAVYDNIHWDEFEERNYPDRKRLLTQSGKVITVSVRRCSSMTTRVRLSRCRHMISFSIPSKFVWISHRLCC
jgi:energy-coupling factor transporter ATP-binding protein EcfA2